MNGRYFIDTNVFVYAFDSTAPAKAAKADKLIHDALTTRRGVISYQVAQEFLNVAFRRFKRPMSLGECQDYLSKVLQPLLAVHSSTALFAEGLRIKDRYGLQWYDSLLVAAALEATCSVFYSEDLQDSLKIGHLRICNPFASTK